jgi:uncharacterized ferritin-like protein (DUF455 family)
MIQRYYGSELKQPFNRTARDAAGMTAAFYEAH